MRHAAQEALCSPEFCSTLGRRKTPFCLFSSRKQEADKVWLVWDGILPQVSLQPSQRHILDITEPPDDFRRTLDPYSGNVSDLTDSALCSLIKPLHQLAELTGKRGHSTENPIPSLPSAGAASPGTSPGRSECLPLTWRDPGAGRPPNRQEDGCALGLSWDLEGREEKSHEVPAWKWAECA